MTALDTRRVEGLPADDLVARLVEPLQQLPASPSALANPVSASTNWQLLCDSGLAGVLAPVEHGGQGGGITEAVAIASALTRRRLTLPYLSSAVHATLLAKAAGATRLLAELTTGDRVASVAIGGELRHEGRGCFVSGMVRDALDGGEADVWLVGVTSASGWKLVEIDRPSSASLTLSEDPTRPVVHASLKSAPARLLQEHCYDSLVRAAQFTEIVRAAEVLSAAEAMLTPGPSKQLLLGAARGLIDSAAAAVDLDGSIPEEFLDTLRYWTARVAAAAELATVGTLDERTRLLHARTTLRSGWVPPRPPAGIPGMARSPEASIQGTTGRNFPTACNSHPDGQRL